MSTGRRIMIAIGLVVAVIVIAFFEYYLPRSVVMEITGVEYRPIGGSADEASTSAGQQNVGVSFITAKNPEDANDTMEFFNTDAGLYLKFDAGSVHSQANALNGEPALITFYGWRWAILSIYPNVISVQQADADTSTFPYFKIVFYVLFAAALVWLYRRVRRLFGGGAAAAAPASSDSNTSPPDGGPSAA